MTTSNQESCSSTTAHRSSSSHATSSTTEGRQAIPVTPDRPTAIPRLKILALRYRWLLRPANDFGVGRSSRWNLFNALGMHGRRTTAGWRNFPDPLHCMRRLHRAQYELGRWSIQTAGPNAYATTTLQTALLIRQIGRPRASRLLLCVMPAERSLIHAQMRHRESSKQLPLASAVD